MLGPFEFDFDFAWPSNHPMASLALSPYSPLALRDLPQPIPNDVPANLDATIFTFEDAFEDLLVVSQGLPLPEISTRYEQRKLLRSMYPAGEPAWFWLRRLKAQGLLDVRGPGEMVRANWDAFHKELDRRATDVWRAAMGEREREREERRSWDEIDEDRERKNNNDDGFRGHNPLLEDSEQHRQRRRQPDHFEDLFSSVQTSFPSAQSSWDTFVKSITDEPASNRPRPRSDEKQVVTKDEYVDRFGYLHSKVTVKTLDEEGNQIGNQTHYTVRPAEKREGGEDGAEKKDGEGVKVDGRVETKAGWFWK